MGVARLARLKKLLAINSKRIEYSGCQACLYTELFCAPLLLVLVTSLLPSANAFTRRKFRANWAGPVARFGGMIFCPGDGSISNTPYEVFTTLACDKSVAKEGRSLKMESPFLSRPSVILKGRPELSNRNGLR